MITDILNGRGCLVLPIFIRQGWPKAMNHLSAIEGQALCGPAFPQALPSVRGEGMRS
jgi:hypothetical protein